MKLPFSSVLKWKPKLAMQKMGFIGAFYLLLLLPTVAMLFHISHRSKEISLMKNQMSYLGIRMERVKEMEKGRKAFVKDYGDADPHFINRVIEPMTFLKPEVEALKLVYNHPAFESCENVKERLAELIEGGNQLSFSKTGRQVQNEVEEVFLLQKHPVEINGRDLKEVLFAIEEPSQNSPQLIVRHFQLSKKKLAERETYLLNMELIKRGVLK